MSALPAGYRLEPDPARWDYEAMHTYLEQTYWSKALTRECRQKGFDHSLGVAVFAGARQIGYARAVTDYARFAYVADVYVEDDHTGRGIARTMVRWLHEHPDMATITRWLLVTRDAAGVYAKLGYGEPDDAALFMQRRVTR